MVSPEKRQKYAMLFSGIGVILILASFYFLSSPAFTGKVDALKQKMSVMSSDKYYVLYEIRQKTSTTRISLSDKRWFAKTMCQDFIEAVTPQVISVGNETLVPNLVSVSVFIDNNFYEAGTGYAILKIPTSSDTLIVLARVSLNGNVVSINPISGVEIGKDGKLSGYLIAYPNAGFSFRKYSSITPDISPYFTPDGNLKDPVSLRPIPVKTIWESP